MNLDLLARVALRDQKAFKQLYLRKNGSWFLQIVISVHGSDKLNVSRRMRFMRTTPAVTCARGM